MKKILSAATILLVAVSFSPLAFSADSQAAYKECNSEAEKNEVSAEDLKTFISNCMAEMDVAAADIKALVDPDSDGGQKSEGAKDE